MAKKAYVGVSNVARRSKKIYIGVGGKARKVKKGYIGVNGVARLFYQSTLEAKRYGTTTVRNESRYSNFAAESIGNYALFAGGAYNAATNTNYVNAYNSSLVLTNPTGLSQSRTYIGSGACDTYALFAGGMTSWDGGYGTTTVDAYNSSLTRSIPTGLSNSLREVGGIKFNGKAVFAGGRTSTSYTGIIYKQLTIYDNSLSKTTSGELSDAQIGINAATVGNYLLFGGGAHISYSSTMGYSGVTTIDAFNSSFTRTSATPLSSASRFILGMGNDDNTASIENYAIFKLDNSSPSLNAYDKSLTQTFPPDLSYTSWSRAGVVVAVNGFFIVGPIGSSAGASSFVHVNAYNASLTRMVLDNFSVSEANVGYPGATVGNFAIFPMYGTTEVYEVS